MQQRKIGAGLAYLNILLKNGIYLVYTPLLLRLVGKADYGIYQLTSQLVSSLTLLALGFSGAYVHFYWVEKKKSEKAVALLNGLYLKIFSMVGVASIVAGTILITFSKALFGSSFTDSELATTKVMLSLMVLNIAITFVSSVFDSYIAANQRFLFQQTRIMVTTLLQPIIVIPGILLGFGVIMISLVQLAFSIILLIANANFARKQLKMKFAFGKGSGLLFKSVISFSGILLINDAVDLINNNLPGVLTGSILGPGAVAVYAIVIQIRNIFIQLSTALSSVFIPRVNELVSEGATDEQLTDLMINVGKSQFSILIFVYGGFVVAGKWFIQQWAGNNFGMAYWMLVVVMLPLLVPLSQNLGLEIQRAKNKHAVRSWVLGVFAVLNIGITYISIKVFGVSGSVTGYVVSILVGNGVAINLYNHFMVGLNMVKYWSKMLPIMFFSFVSIIAAELLKLVVPGNLFMQTSVGVFVYVVLFAVLFWFFVLSKDEKNQIMHGVKKFIK